MTNRTVALVPLRGGSQSIPGKNIKVIAGKPLCQWTLEAACKCERIDRVYVSTDSPEIKRVVESFGLPIVVIDRPAVLATGTATTESVMLDFADRFAFSSVVTIQATSPLTTAVDLTQALETFESQELDSMVTGVIHKCFVWTIGGIPLNYDPVNRPMRQQWVGTLVENGAFYVTTREILTKHLCRLGGKIGTFAMGPETAVEIDEPSDWKICEDILVARDRTVSTNDPLRKIRLVICDVDGTLTDGGMYYDHNGEVMKKFNTRDAHGLGMIQQQGVRVVIVTREISPVSAARARKLNLTIHEGVKDKATLLPMLLQEYQLRADQVAMLGDDVNDLEIMRLCGYSACPSDAATEIKNIASFVASKPGGEGAVREFCDRLIAGGK